MAVRRELPGGATIFAEGSRGTDVRISGSLSLRPTSAARVEATLATSRITRRLDGAEYARTLIPRVKAEYQLTRAMFVPGLGRFNEAIGAAFAAEIGSPLPEVAGFGVAGPVVAGRCATTNLPWVIDERELVAAIDAYKGENARLEGAVAAQERIITERQSLRWWLRLPGLRARLWWRQATGR